MQLEQRSFLKILFFNKSNLVKNDILFYCRRSVSVGELGKIAIEHWNVEPDLVALGKGMTAGYTPMAATLDSFDKMWKPILQVPKAIMSGHLHHGANPYQQRLPLYVLEYIGLSAVSELKKKWKLLEKITRFKRKKSQ
ncbi:hypothetical protein KHA80_21860 [Anaerobacillus sp. HL2]|nr:hypothetical protein KHA80_21860 [Anaerobacillus sp. HL2]